MHKHKSSNMKSKHCMTLKHPRIANNGIITVRIEMTTAILWTHKTHLCHGMAIFRGWDLSCVLMKNFLWTTCDRAQGPDWQNYDCKGGWSSYAAGEAAPCGC